LIHDQRRIAHPTLTERRRHVRVNHRCHDTGSAGTETH
jgi:hypothetical protein